MYALASSGVVWRRLGTGAVCVVGAVALLRAKHGRMYALASFWRRLGTGTLLLAKWRRCWAPAPRPFRYRMKRYFGNCAPRGRMYALASVWRRLAISDWFFQQRRFRGRRRYVAACQGVGWFVRPGVVWRRLGTGADFVAQHLVFSSRLRGRCLRSFTGAQSYVESTV